MHLVQRAEKIELLLAYPGSSIGFSRYPLVDEVHSVHMGLGLCSLDPGGSVDEHLHSFEESFYVLEGSPALVRDGRAYRLEPDACGVLPVGVPHAWLGLEAPARWIEMVAPRPRGLQASPATPGRKTRVEGAASPDTFFLGPSVGLDDLVAPDVRDPRERNFFRLDDGQMDVDNLKAGAPIDAPTVSASMATALLAYSGIAVKMLVDQRLDAQLHTMFMVEYQPGGVAHRHDHPFEEAYVMLEGEVVAEADGERYVLKAGDTFWTGVGCIHAFYNESGARVRWLETQAPQPPSRHSYRFDRDWEYLQSRIESSSEAPTGVDATGEVASDKQQQGGYA